jgi:hypothetical protein
MRYFHPGLLAQAMVEYPNAASVIQHASRAFVDRQEVQAKLQEAKAQAVEVEEFCKSMER